MLFKRIEEAAFGRGNSSEKTSRIIHSLRGDFRLKDILAVVKFPKATYMYWQTRFNRQPRNQKLEEKITELHKEHKDFGYRRMHGMLIKLGYHVTRSGFKELCRN